MTATLQTMKVELKRGEAYQGASIPPREIDMILSHVTGYSKADLMMKMDDSVSERQKAQIFEIADRLVVGEPLTRVLGIREFWGLDFKVTPDVLDPRADTETLIEAVLKWVAQQDDLPSRPPACGHGEKQISILDLGTGTGCIPIALLSELPNVTAVAVDISPEALAVARGNAVRHGVADRIEFIQGDWFEAFAGRTPNAPFDIITSNPPYIADSVIPNLDENVKNHDPFLALSGGESGLEAYKKIISGLKTHLKVGGHAFLEIGFDQEESVPRLVDDSNLSMVASYQDLGGNPRVLEILKASRGDK